MTLKITSKIPTAEPGRSTAFTRNPAAVIVFLLTALTLFVYAQTRQFEFLSLDDGLYVASNPRVRSGLSLEGIVWSFRVPSPSGTHWHPLAWISHMVDAEIFGLNPGAHHLVNVGFHLVNSLMLFAALRRLSGALWMSVIVAALFAVHPIQVESIAWIAARKNVLSTSFWLLSTHFYISYATKPNLLRYALVTAAFALGLLTKPMLVTLPFALLLLDYWPMRRLQLPLRDGLPREAVAIPVKFPRRSWRRVTAEKIPWLLLALVFTGLAAYSVSSIAPQNEHGSIPLGLRLENALVSYPTYLSKLLFPAGLAMFYPYPFSIPSWKTVLAASFVCGITLWFFRWRVERPYLIVGWLWFIGTLVPVLGIFQSGVWPAWADRWAYVPSIGVFIMLVWGGGEIFFRLGSRKLTIAASTSAAIVLLSGVAYLQAETWRNDFVLYRHAVTQVTGNYFAYGCLAEAYHRMRRFKEAEGLYAKALEIAPWFVPARIGMAKTLHESGDLSGAFHHLKEALKLNPYEINAYNNLGVLYVKYGEMEEAKRAFKLALAIDDGHAEAHNNLGFVYLRTGMIPEARAHLDKALALDPGNLMALENMMELSSPDIRR
jgi:tetratricopeptide (TPR) repeat protein